jgi:hypothetical protein
MADFILVGVDSTMAVEVFKLAAASAMADLALRRGDASDKVAGEEEQASLEDAGIKVIAPFGRNYTQGESSGTAGMGNFANSRDDWGGTERLQFQLSQQL